MVLLDGLIGILWVFEENSGSALVQCGSQHLANRAKQVLTNRGGVSAAASSIEKEKVV